MSGCCNHCDCDRHHKTVAGLLERPRYSPGLILEDSDLTAAVTYTQELNRLLFRSLFGCGVICGLDVSVVDKCGLEVTVNSGLALDGCGDPIQVPSPAKITLDEKDGVEVEEGKDRPRERNFWVVLCGKEKLCAPRSVLCDADEIEEAAQPTRIRALAEISIKFKRPHCLCECAESDEVDDNALDALAERLLPRDPKATAELPDCHRAHKKELICRCDCGECVLLAWVHWFPNEGWTVLHRGVRRFIRPVLIEPDPIEDVRLEPRSATGTPKTGAKKGKAKSAPGNIN